MTILVTGATGNIGGRVAELLHARRATIRRLARDPAKAPPLADAPAEARFMARIVPESMVMTRQANSEDAQ